MISKGMAIILMLAPIVGFNVFRFFLEPHMYTHAYLVAHEGWMRGEAYAALSLLLFYIWIALLILIMPKEK